MGQWRDVEGELHVVPCVYFVSLANALITGLKKKKKKTYAQGRLRKCIEEIEAACPDVALSLIPSDLAIRSFKKSCFRKLWHSTLFQRTYLVPGRVLLSSKALSSTSFGVQNRSGPEGSSNRHRHVLKKGHPWESESCGISTGSPVMGSK